MTDRVEVSRSYSLANGRRVTIILRDKLAPDDIIVNRARAKVHALRVDEDVDTVPVSRNVKDLLIRSNIG
jgi:hypothetical protein